MATDNSTTTVVERKEAHPLTLDLGGIISAVDRTKATEAAKEAAQDTRAPRPIAIKPLTTQNLGLESVIKLLEEKSYRLGESASGGDATWDWITYRKEDPARGTQYALINPDERFITYLDDSLDHPLPPADFLEAYFAKRAAVQADIEDAGKSLPGKMDEVIEASTVLGIVIGGFIGGFAGAVMETMYPIIIGVASLGAIGGAAQYVYNQKAIKQLGGTKARYATAQSQHDEFHRRHDIRTGMDAYLKLKI